MSCRYTGKTGIAVLTALLFTALCGCAAKSGDGFAGTQRDTEYRNDTFGISFSLPEEWYFLTGEEIAEATGAVRDAYTETENAQRLFGTSQQFYDVYASTEDGFRQMNIVIGVPAPVERMRLRFDKDAAMPDNLPETIDGITAGTELENDKIVSATASFLGETVPCLVWTGELRTEFGTIPVYRKQVTRVSDGRDALMTITVTSYLDDGTDGILAGFRNR